MSFIVLAVGLTAAGVYQGYKASKDQERQANIDNARERARAIARARVARGSSENAAALSGGAGSSGASAALSQISSTTATAIGNQQQMVSLGNRINRRIAQGEIYGKAAQLATMGIKPTAGTTSTKDGNAVAAAASAAPKPPINWIGPRP